MSSTAIKTKNISRQFGTVTALKQVNIEVPKGIVFGFLGPNGSGKTTTIRVLLGLLKPDQGSAQVLGYDAQAEGDQVRQRCGALLEHSGLYERLSAVDNLELFGRMWHIPRVERNQRIQQLLQDLDLWDRRKDQVGTWSRGMKQKLAVARTMLHNPELIFLDEPTAGLDPVAAAALREDLLNLVKSQGVTVFLTTHNLAEAEKMCSQVAVIRKGELLTVASPDELRLQQGGARLEVVGSGFTDEIISSLSDREEVVKVEQVDHHLAIDLKGEVNSGELVQYLVSKGVMIEEVRKGKASLEEAFLKLLEVEA
jgi:ABC-2 type transport system ATP-binding protein